MSISLDENLPSSVINKQFDIKENNISKLLNEVNNSINNLKTLLINNSDLNPNEKFNNYFVEINNSIEILVNNIKSNIRQYESLKRKDEEALRKLYSKYFNQKLINEVLENKLSFLKKKEKEYELLKQKTGAIICNGKVICNERKDNEIFILRTENSLIKNVIKKNEELLKEKNDIISSLNNDILLYKTKLEELHKVKHGKYSSFSNININISEPKKDYIQKDSILNNNKSYIKSINIFPYNKKIENQNQNFNATKVNNNIRNIYTSYQKNSQLINKVNNVKNKSRSNNKDEMLQKYISKNINKNETIDSINNKTYSTKYISVNKSLFSPAIRKKSKKGLNNSKNRDEKVIHQINRIKKKKYILDNNLSIREYKTITIDRNNNREVIVKKAILNKKPYFNHRKANSIQWPDNSIKQIIKEKKDQLETIDNEKHSFIYSAIKKISQIRNQTLKNNKSLSSSMKKSLHDGFNTNNQMNNNKSLSYFLMPYDDKNKDKKGRNDNYKVGSEYIKDNSLNFLQQTSMNKTIPDNYFNNEKSSFNIL